MDNIDTTIEDMKIPDCTFILGGYSWLRRSFQLWKIRYTKELKRFHYDSATTLCGKKAIFAGDAWTLLKDETLRILRNQRGHALGKNPLNLEPLEALRNLLKNEDRALSIGGAPQFVKVYQHLNAEVIPMYWPVNQRSTATYLGRKLLPYERIDDWVLDLDTMERSPMTQ
jgi:hypothetical protein